MRRTRERVRMLPAAWIRAARAGKRVFLSTLRVARCPRERTRKLPAAWIRATRAGNRVYLSTLRVARCPRAHAKVACRVDSSRTGGETRMPCHPARCTMSIQRKGPFHAKSQANLLVLILVSEKEYLCSYLGERRVEVKR